MLKCRHCDFNNPDGMNYCGKCGHPLQPGSMYHPADDLASGSPPAYAHSHSRDYTPEFLLESVLRSRHAMAGENKRVAVLFADVVGFTQIAEGLDPESLHQLMGGCFKILREVVHGAGGTINQYTGDGIMAIFGAPIALEDYTAKACFAALEIQRRLVSYTADVNHQFGIDFKMRIGINAGQVLVGAIGDNLRLDYTAIGDTTNLAARLQASAAPGAIHVSERVAASAAHRFRFEDMGTHRIKGKSLPQRIFRLVAEKNQPALALNATAVKGALMGRENELTRLKKAWRSAHPTDRF